MPHFKDSKLKPLYDALPVRVRDLAESFWTRHAHFEVNKSICAINMGDALSRCIAEHRMRGMAMDSFNVGDWAWHPVHKVKMQVVKVLPPGDLLCEYKDNNGEIKRLDFPPSALQSLEDHEAERRERNERAARNRPEVITSRSRYRRTR